MPLSRSLLLKLASAAFAGALALDPHQLASAANPPPQSTIVFQHATVIDVTGNPPQADQSVVIVAGKITTVGRTGAVSVPAGSKTIDATGKYLIPGLWDMHVHFHIKYP